jgi:aminoglycoside phosphotransferase (APT) family kinase protein
MTNATAPIDVDLVRRLVDAQFPVWSTMDVRAVDESGWDNRSFRLGQDLIIRLPSAESYAAQVDREQVWLPRISPHLSQPIPIPVALGQSQFGYPCRWSIYRWLEGEAARPERIGQLAAFARDLAAFLRSLQAAPAAGGPAPGPENFHRGGSLGVYDSEARRAIAILTPRLNVRAASATWEAALASKWDQTAVWVHGDIAVGNLLVKAGELCGVIDFGQFCVGDPACDLAPAWTLLDAESRETFRTSIALDEGTWARGRGWTLWKALIVAARLVDTNAWEGTQCWSTIENVLADHAQTEA